MGRSLKRKGFRIYEQVDTSCRSEFVLGSEQRPNSFEASRGRNCVLYFALSSREQLLQFVRTQQPRALWGGKCEFRHCHRIDIGVQCENNIFEAAALARNEVLASVRSVEVTIDSRQNQNTWRIEVPSSSARKKNEITIHALSPWVTALNSI